MIRAHLLCTVSAVALVSGLAAQDPSQGIATAEYAARRDSLTARMDSGVVIAFGAPDPVSIGRWNQLPAFRYLTGFLEPNAALVLVKQVGAASGTLFTAARDPRRALYDGFPPDSATVARQTGLEVRSLPSLAPLVDSLVGLGLPVYDLRDYATWDAAGQDSLTRGARFIADLVARQPAKGLEVRDAHPRLDSLRAVKSPAELAQLRHAINITVGSLKQ
ncbi:MAG: Xaa-Pro aminopeptidase, partial [Gemmatimonadales bacterium]|nr:Xaa-Pro aminopeptidase [Gemmatimonadales bacterium]